MKLKLFNLRLDAANSGGDQNAINTFIESVDIRKSATQYVPDSPDFWSILFFYDEKKKEKRAKITEADLSDDSKTVYAAFKLWRKDRATEINLPEFMIFQNATLIEIAHTRPTVNDLCNIKGVTADKMAKYGDDILAILGAF